MGIIFCTWLRSLCLLSFIWCTDLPNNPIAVLAIVKKLKAKQIAVQVEGESLFNDGIGLVIFMALFAAFSGERPAYVCELFLFDAIGGILFGAFGCRAHFMIQQAHDASLELLVAICIPTAGFALANHLGISAALAMVVRGLLLVIGVVMMVSHPRIARIWIIFGI